MLCPRDEAIRGEREEDDDDGRDFHGCAVRTLPATRRLPLRGVTGTVFRTAVRDRPGTRRGSGLAAQLPQVTVSSASGVPCVHLRKTPLRKTPAFGIVPGPIRHDRRTAERASRAMLGIGTTLGGICDARSLRAGRPRTPLRPNAPTRQYDARHADDRTPGALGGDRGAPD